jgi:hypothetical protein
MLNGLSAVFISSEQRTVFDGTHLTSLSEVSYSTYEVSTSYPLPYVIFAMGCDCLCGTGYLMDPLSIHRWYMSEYGAAVEWYWQGKTEGLGEKPVLVALCKHKSHMDWPGREPRTSRWEAEDQSSPSLQPNKVLCLLMKGVKFRLWDLKVNSSHT